MRLKNKNYCYYYYYILLHTTTYYYIQQQQLLLPLLRLVRLLLLLLLLLTTSVLYPMNVPGREIIGNYAKEYVIHPDLGVQVMKTRLVADRCKLPEDVVILKSMWEIGVTSGRMPLDDTCHICGVGMALSTCPFCRLTYHKACDKALCSFFKSSGLRGWKVHPAIRLQDVLAWHDHALSRITSCECCWEAM